MLPIYIPSYQRSKTIKTSLYLDAKNISYKVLLHTEKEKEEYVSAGRVRGEDIIVTNAAKGITHQRNYICENLAVRGKWHITLDDNISGFKRVIDKHYFTKKSIDVDSPDVTQTSFNQPVHADEFVKLLEEDIKIAEQIKSYYCGFASVDNYFFNSKKYRPVGYVISKAVAIKYDGSTYDKKLNGMEDFGFTAAQLLAHGKVLINGWIKPINGHYEKGGIGTYEERLPSKIHDAALLIKKFPGLFRYKEKKGCHPKAELQIRFHSPKQVQDWRVAMRNR